MPKSKERCQEIREETKQKIIQASILYFAKSGFAGTKISELAKQIGIAQGTIYIYFESKEDLFREIYSAVNNEADIDEIRKLSLHLIPARKKIQLLSETILKRLQEEDGYAAKVALNAQMMFEKKGYVAQNSTYQSNLYRYTAKIIEQGQREKVVVEGSAMKLADYYWGVVYLYALKKLFTSEYEMISANDLERVLFN